MSRREEEEAPLPPSASSPSPIPPLSRPSASPPSAAADVAALMPPSSSAPSSSSSLSSLPPVLSSSSPASPSSSFRSSLQLTMYRNQVAGHSPLFWHSGTICKPLIRSEYEFYAGLERDMPAFMPYVPKFYGLLDLEQLTEEMASSIVSSSGGDERGGREEEKEVALKDSSLSVSSGAVEVKERAAEEDAVEEEKEGRVDDDRKAASAPLPVPPASADSRTMTANNHAWSSHKLYNKWAMKCSQRKAGAANKQQIRPSPRHTQPLCPCASALSSSLRPSDRCSPAVCCGV